jgi:hypothetical protein
MVRLLGCAQTTAHISKLPHIRVHQFGHVHHGWGWTINSHPTASAPVVAPSSAVTIAAATDTEVKQSQTSLPPAGNSISKGSNNNDLLSINAATDTHGQPLWLEWRRSWCQPLSSSSSSSLSTLRPCACSSPTNTVTIAP